MIGPKYRTLWELYSDKYSQSIDKYSNIRRLAGVFWVKKTRLAAQGKRGKEYPEDTGILARSGGGL